METQEKGGKLLYYNGLVSIRLEGFGPPTFGSVDRRPENVSPEKTNTCETSKEQLTPQLTPKSPKQDKIDTSELSPDLSEIINVWPKLPEHIKAAIKALVQTNIQGDLQ